MDPYLHNKDLGMVEMKGLHTQHDFALTSIPNIKAKARLTDVLFCYFRQVLREGVNIRIRHEQQHPIPGSRGKTRIVGQDDPPQHLNKNNYNPAIERRLSYKFVTLPKQKAGKWMNVNYQLDTEENRMAARSDIKKVETHDKLAIKPEEEQPREVDFTVEASFREIKRIMIQCKF